MRDLKAALLAAADLSAQARERGPERTLDVVGLQAPRPCLVHQRTQLRDVRVLHRVARQRALGEQFLDAAGDAGVDDLLHVRLRLRQLAVADRVDEQRAQRRLAERRAKDVEDLAAVGLALLFDLQQQPLEDLALAGVVGDEVPQAADLLLADAVDAPEALLDPVRVPRQVVVDHQVRDLEVQALPGSVGREQNLEGGVARELLGDLATLGATHAAVDRLDGLGPAEERARSGARGTPACRDAR